MLSLLSGCLPWIFEMVRIVSNCEMDVFMQSNVPTSLDLTFLSRDRHEYASAIRFWILCLLQ